MFEAKKFDSINGVDGMSERLMTEHYKLYEGYIKKANEITEKLKTVDLSTANATQSDLRALKMGYSFAVNAIKSHELYFGNISGKGGQPNGWLGQQIEKHFGSFENWQADMKATGIAARGWVWTAFDWQTGSLFNYLGDAHDAFPIWHATPLIALDVYEHAYMIDYGVARADYIDTFFKNLNWDGAEQLASTTGMDKMESK
ncbi:MAG TPA: superoxide dismutase [Patescibacteria group bacterium]|jgi:Fe-Mn family superoxide dismutase|nr:superoxide dismutase [Patescibacteria group bacterium]